MFVYFRLDEQCYEILELISMSCLVSHGYELGCEFIEKWIFFGDCKT